FARLFAPRTAGPGSRGGSSSGLGEGFALRIEGPGQDPPGRHSLREGAGEARALVRRSRGVPCRKPGARGWVLENASRQGGGRAPKRLGHQRGKSSAARSAEDKRGRTLPTLA